MTRRIILFIKFRVFPVHDKDVFQYDQYPELEKRLLTKYYLHKLLKSKRKLLEESPLAEE